MPPQSKRRRFYSLLTLPLVVVIGFLTVAQLTVWQRSDLIADLADRIVHGEARDAIEAVHKLAAMPNPPIAVLVTAAAADEHETAGAAQVAIDRLLRRWQRDVEMKKRFNGISDELSQLSKSISITLPEFSDSDRPWLESATRKILRIADKFPPDKTPIVAIHCDAVLTAIGAGRSSVKSRDLGESEDIDQLSVGFPDARRIPKVALSPLTSGGSSATPLLTNPVNDMAAAPAPFTVPTTTGPLPRSGSVMPDQLRDESPANELRAQELGNGFGDGNGTADRLVARPALPMRTAEAGSIFRVLPSIPSSPAMNSEEVLKESALTNPRMSDSKTDISTSSPLAGTDSRELLKSWLASGNGSALPIEHELAKRGFGKLSAPLVRQFLSENPQERIELLDKVLTRPGGASEAWLLLLTTDADPDVRLFAITFMATSNNRMLIEKAWQAAIRDHDPRIADLAGRLHERRDGPLRR